MVRAITEIPAEIVGDVFAPGSFGLLLHVRPVTCLAFERSWIVKDNRLAIYDLARLVTLVAGDSAVPAFQGELGSFVVVESGRHPTLYVMAACACGFALVCSTLSGVCIRVARLASLGNSLELDLLFPR